MVRFLKFARLLKMIRAVKANRILGRMFMRYEIDQDVFKIGKEAGGCVCVCVWLCVVSYGIQSLNSVEHQIPLNPCIPLLQLFC